MNMITGNVSITAVNISGMRKAPDRIYEVKPEEEASRAINVSLTPFHLFALEKITEGKKGQNPKGTSPQLKALIERIAEQEGITQEDWQRCQNKQDYMKGRKGVGEKELERRKAKRRSV